MPWDQYGNPIGEDIDDPIIVQPLGSGIMGVATGGSSTTVVDTTKNFATNMLANKMIKLRIGDTEYIRIITSNTNDTLTIPVVEPALPASCQLFIGYDYCIGVTYDTPGVAGNAFNVEVTAETGAGHENVNLSATLADSTITVILGTDGAGALSAAKNEASMVAGVIDAISGFTSIALASESEPVVTTCDISLSGGIDAYGAVLGTQYEIIYNITDITGSSIAVPVDLQYNQLTNAEALPIKQYSRLSDASQIGSDQAASFANSALVNTQIAAMVFTKPAAPSLLHKVKVRNPSTVTDLTIKIFTVDVGFPTGTDTSTYITYLNVPKAQAVTGTTILSYEFEIEGLFANGNAAFVVSNDTALGVADAFIGYLRLVSM